jgi:deoxyribonuclease V
MSDVYWPSTKIEAEQEQLALLELLNNDGIETAGERCLAIGTAFSELQKKAIAVGVEFKVGGTVRNTQVSCEVETQFPYIPGLLAFRVGPAISALLNEIGADYDTIIVDGQGIAHPRGLGLAAHIGIIYNVPTIGITRNSLFGEYSTPRSEEAACSQVTHPRNRTVIGQVFRIGSSHELAFSSPGHKHSVQSCCNMMVELIDNKSPFPRPLRRAHAIANATAKELDCGDFS